MWILNRSCMVYQATEQLDLEREQIYNVFFCVAATDDLNPLQHRVFLNPSLILYLTSSVLIFDHIKRKLDEKA